MIWEHHTPWFRLCTTCSLVVFPRLTIPCTTELAPAYPMSSSVFCYVFSHAKPSLVYHFGAHYEGLVLISRNLGYLPQSLVLWQNSQSSSSLLQNILANITNTSLSTYLPGLIILLPYAAIPSHLTAILLHLTASFSYILYYSSYTSWQFSRPSQWFFSHHTAWFLAPYQLVTCYSPNPLYTQPLTLWAFDLWLFGNFWPLRLSLCILHPCQLMAITLLQYLIPSNFENFAATLPTFCDPARTYQDFCGSIYRLYLGSGDNERWLVADMYRLVDKYQRIRITSLGDLGNYHHWFLAISLFLCHKNWIAEAEQSQAFSQD